VRGGFIYPTSMRRRQPIVWIRQTIRADETGGTPEEVRGRSLVALDDASYGDRRVYDVTGGRERSRRLEVNDEC